MYTRCPHCRTLFRVHPQQLSAARGRARCSHCGQVFDAIEQLQSEPDTDEGGQQTAAGTPPQPPAEAPAPAAVSEATTAEDPHLDTTLGGFEVELGPAPVEQGVTLEPPDESTLDAELRRMAEFYEQTVEQSREWSTALTPPPAMEIPLDADRLTLSPPGADIHDDGRTTRETPDDTPLAATPVGPAPSRPGPPPQASDELPPPPKKRKKRRGGRAGWFIGVLLLLAAALAQLAWFQRQRLLTDPRSRPLLEQLCERFDCTLPPVSAPQRLKVLQRSVVGHPDRPGGLLIRLRFVNQAPFPQPYPLLQMTLFDRNGKPLGRRRFRPEQYLATPVGDRSLLQPGQQVDVKMGLVDPGPAATGFKFDFLPAGATTAPATTAH